MEEYRPDHLPRPEGDDCGDDADASSSRLPLERPAYPERRRLHRGRHRRSRRCRRCPAVAGGEVKTEGDCPRGLALSVNDRMRAVGLGRFGNPARRAGASVPVPAGAAQGGSDRDAIGLNGAGPADAIPGGWAGRRGEGLCLLAGGRRTVSPRAGTVPAQEAVPPAARDSQPGSRPACPTVRAARARAGSESACRRPNRRPRACRRASCASEVACEVRRRSGPRSGGST